MLSHVYMVGDKGVLTYGIRVLSTWWEIKVVWDKGCIHGEG